MVAPGGQGFSFGGYSPGGLGDRSRRSLETFFTDFDRRNDQNLKSSHNSSPDFLTSMFHLEE